MTARELPDELVTRLDLPMDRPLVTLAQIAQRAPAAGVYHAVGSGGCGAALVARHFIEAGAPSVVIVAANSDGARRVAADVGSFAESLPVRGPLARGLGELAQALVLIASDGSAYAEVHPDRRAAMTRAGALHHIATNRPWRFLVTTAAALVRRVAPPHLLVSSGVDLAVGGELDLESTVRRFVAGGYLRVPVVEDAGSFAVRGGVLDVWGPAASYPVRVELAGDTIVSLRRFEADDQRTVGELASVSLGPAREAVVTSAAAGRARELVRSLCDEVNLPSTKTRHLVEDVAAGKVFFGAEGFLPAYCDPVPLHEYFAPEVPIVIEDATSVLAAIRAELEAAAVGYEQRANLPRFPLEMLHATPTELVRMLTERRTVALHRSGVAGAANVASLDILDTVPPDAPTLALHDHEDLTRAVKSARAAHGKQGALGPLVERIELWTERGLEVAVVARASTQAQRVSALLSHRGVDVPVVTASLARGILAPAEGFALVTEEEIFGQRAHRSRAQRRSPRAVLEDLRALAPGDLVVHVEHGIGRYLGLVRREVGGQTVEFLEVEYLGGKLFLPVYRLDQVQKYSGGGDRDVRLDRLGGLSFAKTKSKVRRRIRQMADELLRLYAERAALSKRPLAQPDDEYATFEATFPYEETRDQAIAIDDVMRDLSSDRVMDRLVCGDVGFGKTEVALRAAFRNVMAGRQVALLCPTTVLAQQHYSTFTSRLADYPVVVRALSRFQSKAEQNATIRGLKQGSVDIAIGTHRILSKDVHFKNLGLLVIDEEQRFGVTHKERIKQLRASVDALTLTATPIPRTLQMAVGGLRDMSLITTPPVDRRAIRTISSRFDENLIREAVARELARGGQVFYVYNRVEGLEERGARLQALVPDARVAVAHGQMSEAVLERTMLAFVAGDFDVLVSTAIIESGLDIPRANTMIVDRADLFGLAQLYQLRGRVGRSSERAYCYLLVPPPSQLSDDARSRLEALERHTELGAGFTIATLDLELRGAGELLGAEQSGFAAAVGFEMFCQMLEEATQELRGEAAAPGVDPELSFDVEALIPEEYVAEVGVRLSLYKRLASAADESGVAEIAAEMEDRFGRAPPEAQRLVEMMRLKTELRRLRALGIEASARSVALHLRDDTPLDPAAIGALVADAERGYRLTPGGKLTRRFAVGEGVRDGFDAADRMLDELATCLRADSS
jgi:transcription-repair coupling factor (superfamily II helicase)